LAFAEPVAYLLHRGTPPPWRAYPNRGCTGLRIGACARPYESTFGTETRSGGGHRHRRIAVTSGERSVLITFSGLDGAGKSTLIEWLRATLESENRPVTVFHMNDHVGVHAYLRQLRDLVTGNGRRPEPMAANGWEDLGSGQGSTRGAGLRRLVRRLRYRVVWNKTLRRLVYPVDLLLFLIYRLYVEKLSKRVLIMDRYFYDTLVDVSTERTRLWTRVLERMTPTPTVPVLLDITPEESYSRKAEYSVEYLRRRHVGYNKVFRRVPARVVLANYDFDASKATLRRVVMERLSA
jgi:thymidylate kinase